MSYGPSNPTLVVRVQSESEGDEDEEIDVSELMEMFDEYGNVVMLRLAWILTIHFISASKTPS